MTAAETGEQDKRYLDLLLKPLNKCSAYKPKFGTEEKKGVSLDRFKQMYGSDPFYHWVGLDSELMYAAHKAAGGMTSVYRQLGAGCEMLFQTIIRDSLRLSDDEVKWGFDVTKENGAKATLKLDARIDFKHIRKTADRKRTEKWLGRCSAYLGLPSERAGQLKGAVFEVRQGYKSADAKRQNADLRFAMNGSIANYLPVLAIVSMQASQTVLRRYRNARMLVLTGVLSDDPTTSTYAFFKTVVGYPLDEFFERNSKTMRERCRQMLEALLNPRAGN